MDCNTKPRQPVNDQLAVPASGAKRQARASRHLIAAPSAPSRSGPSVIVVAAHICCRLYDHRPRSHPDGLTSEHHVDVTVAELDASTLLPERTIRNALTRLEDAFQIIRRPGHAAPFPPPPRHRQFG